MSNGELFVATAVQSELINSIIADPNLVLTGVKTVDRPTSAQSLTSQVTARDTFVEAHAAKPTYDADSLGYLLDATATATKPTAEAPYKGNEHSVDLVIGYKYFEEPFSFRALKANQKLHKNANPDNIIQTTWFSVRPDQFHAQDALAGKQVGAIPRIDLGKAQEAAYDAAEMAARAQLETAITDGAAAL